MWDDGPIMITERKVRGDAKLEWLRAEQKKRLLVWLDEENRTYADVVGLVRAEFGVSVGKSAVGCFWRRHVLPRRYRDEAEGAEGIVDMELPEGRFEEATLKLARMQAWAALSQPEPEVRKAERLLAMVWKAERMALAREKLALAQQRVAMREQAAAARAAGAESAAGRKREAKGAGQDAEGGEPKPWMTEEQLREYLKIDFSQWDPPAANPPLFPGSVGIGCDAPSPEATATLRLPSPGYGETPEGYEGGISGGLELGEEELDPEVDPEVVTEEAPTPYDHMKEPWRTWFKVQGLPPTPVPGQPGQAASGNEVRAAEGAKPEAEPRGEGLPAGAAQPQLPATFGFQLLDSPQAG